MIYSKKSFFFDSLGIGCKGGFSLKLAERLLSLREEGHRRIYSKKYHLCFDSHDIGCVVRVSFRLTGTLHFFREVGYRLIYSKKSCLCSYSLDIRCKDGFFSKDRTIGKNCIYSLCWKWNNDRIIVKNLSYGSIFWGMGEILLRITWTLRSGKWVQCYPVFVKWAVSWPIRKKLHQLSRQPILHT